jgi:Resolvase, N terminal domain
MQHRLTIRVSRSGLPDHDIHKRRQDRRIRAAFGIKRRPVGWVYNQRRQRGIRMTVIGYARVSTTDQDLSIQEAVLKAAGCDVIRAEKRSGTSIAGREELRTVLDFLRKGDVLMVTRIDRLARSIGDLQDIVRAIRTKGAALKATEQPIDTSTAAGKCFLDMLGVFAESARGWDRQKSPRRRGGVAGGQRCVLGGVPSETTQRKSRMEHYQRLMNRGREHYHASAMLTYLGALGPCSITPTLR